MTAGRWAGVLAGAVAVVTIAACQGQTLFPPETPRASGAVIATSGGRLPTRLPVLTPEPTATRDLAIIVVTVAPIPTRPDGNVTPTPTLVPAYTSTPRPSPTLMTGSLPMPPPSATPTRPPTRTPAPRGTFVGSAGSDRPEPTETPIDFNEPNDTPNRATPLDAAPMDAYVNGPNDVDVYRFTVTLPNTRLVVTISGERVAGYKVDIVAPRSGKVGYQRFDGTVAMRGIADVGSETGTYLIYVNGVGSEPPEGPYFISAELITPPPAPVPRGG